MGVMIVLIWMYAAVRRRRDPAGYFAITAVSNPSQTDQAVFSSVQRVEKSEADAGLNLK
jgi:hypothetical protein